MTRTMLDALGAMRDATEQLRTGAADVDERRAVSPEVTELLKELGVFQLLAPAASAATRRAR